MRQPHHAGRYQIDELDPPAERLTAEETEEVKGGSDWIYLSTGPALYGPLAPAPALAGDPPQTVPDSS